MAYPARQPMPSDLIDNNILQIVVWESFFFNQSWCLSFIWCCYMVVVNGAENIFNWYQYYCSNVWSLKDK